ncbi:MAG TPA: DUF4342 domain-containing protein [Alphaproteobacteria bacterium]|nr:DUF4342 domain-containing protein [Alphaproteobacteria bacterium]
MTDRNAWKTFTEEIEVAGHQLVTEINRLIAEGNVRKLQIRSQSGDLVVNIPLTAGAVAGGVVVIAAPWLALIAAVAGVLAKVKLEIVRDVPPDASEPPPPLP